MLLHYIIMRKIIVIKLEKILSFMLIITMSNNLKDVLS